jgi:hypothetical protein
MLLKLQERWWIMKLCKDCKHYVPTRLFWIFELKEYARCTQGYVDYVHGAQAKHYCSVSRKYSNLADCCGPDAKWWEAKCS